MKELIVIKQTLTFLKDITPLKLTVIGPRRKGNAHLVSHHFSRRTASFREGSFVFFWYSYILLAAPVTVDPCQASQISWDFRMEVASLSANLVPSQAEAGSRRSFLQKCVLMVIKMGPGWVGIFWVWNTDQQMILMIVIFCCDWILKMSPRRRAGLD